MVARSMVAFDPERIAPWEGGSGQHGILMLHGFTSTPTEMKGLARALAASGFRCSVPMLPGHGTVPEDLARVPWTAWYDAAHQAFGRLQDQCETVSVVGQSMGGSLGLLLAAREPRVASVGALAAPLRIGNPLSALLGVVKHVVRWYRPSSSVDLFDQKAVEDLDSYGRWPTAAIHELARLLAALRLEIPSIRQPVFLAHGGRDRMVTPHAVEVLSRRLLNSRSVAVKVYQRCGHALTVDIDHDILASDLASWLASPDASAVCA